MATKKKITIPQRNYIPPYLRPLAQEPKTTVERGGDHEYLTTFQLKCPCGCDKFSVLKKKPASDIRTKEDVELELLGPRLKNSFLGHWPFVRWRSWSSKDGKLHERMKFLWRTLLDSETKDVFVYDYRYLKIRCTNCGVEYDVFHGLMHGYDNLEDVLDKNLRERSERAITYSKEPPSFSTVRKETKVAIRVRHRSEDYDYDEFSEAFKEYATEELPIEDLYAAGYDRIDVYAVTDNGKVCVFTCDME